MLLYDCAPKSSQLLSIDKPLKNANVLQLRLGKNLTTLLYSDLSNLKKFLMKKRLEKYKNNKTISCL